MSFVPLIMKHVRMMRGRIQKTIHLIITGRQSWWISRWVKRRKGCCGGAFPLTSVWRWCRALYSFFMSDSRSSSRVTDTQTDGEQFKSNPRVCSLHWHKYSNSNPSTHFGRSSSLSWAPAVSPAAPETPPVPAGPSSRLPRHLQTQWISGGETHEQDVWASTQLHFKTQILQKVTDHM